MATNDQKACRPAKLRRCFPHNNVSRYEVPQRNMGTGLFVSVKRGRAFASADIETLTDEELQDLLRRASPAQARAYCIWLAQWARMKRRSEANAPSKEGVKKKINK